MQEIWFWLWFFLFYLLVLRSWYERCGVNTWDRTELCCAVVSIAIIFFCSLFFSYEVLRGLLASDLCFSLWFVRLFISRFGRPLGLWELLSPFFNVEAGRSEDRGPIHPEGLSRVLSNSRGTCLTDACPHRLYLLGGTFIGWFFFSSVFLVLRIGKVYESPRVSSYTGDALHSSIVFFQRTFSCSVAWQQLWNPGHKFITTLPRFQILKYFIS